MTEEDRNWFIGQLAALHAALALCFRETVLAKNPHNPTDAQREMSQLAKQLEEHLGALQAELQNVGSEDFAKGFAVGIECIAREIRSGVIMTTPSDPNAH